MKCWPGRRFSSLVHSEVGEDRGCLVLGRTRFCAHALTLCERQPVLERTFVVLHFNHSGPLVSKRSLAPSLSSAVV